MIFRVHRPGPPLHRLVHEMVYYADYVPDHHLERVLPDASVNLIIDLDTGAKHVFDNDSLAKISAYRKAWVSGVQRGFLTIEATPNSSMLVVRMKPGWAASLLGVPLKEISNQVVDGDLVFGSDLWTLRDELLEIPTPEGKLKRLERFLCDRLRPQMIPHGAVEFAMRTLSATADGLTVNRVHLDVGFSRKHLAGLFEHWVGITPKAYQRICRFQQVLAEIERHQKVNWTRLALDCGYYDQSHFINEFKQFCGMNPSQYLVEKGEYTGFLPIDRNPI
jgi:AraC-like DNA-binding protein